MSRPPTARSGSARQPRPRAISPPRGSSTRPAARAPTRCIPATASSPRARRSRKRASRPGLRFVGPSPDVIASAGSKLEARRLAASGRRAGGARQRARGPDPGRRAGRRRRGRLPGAAEAVGRRRRQGHAGGPDGRRDGGRHRPDPPRGRRGLRRRDPLRGASPAAPAPCRGAGGRRPARPGRAPLRARVLHPAPLPEGDRGEPGAGAARGAAPGADRRRDRAGAGRPATTTSAPWSFSWRAPGPPAASTSSR